MTKAPIKSLNHIFFTLIVVFLSVALLWSCAPQSTGPQFSNQMAFDEGVYQQDEAIKKIKDDLDYIFSVSRRIMTKNVDYCYQNTGSTKRLIDYGFHTSTKTFLADGWSLFNPDQYDASPRDPIRGQPRIVYIEPNSSSYGILRAGDEILSVNDVLLNELTYQDNIEAFKQALKDAPNKLRMNVSRNGKVQKLYVTAQQVCPSRVLVKVDHGTTQKQSDNAWADGKNIVVTTSIANFTETSSELALIIGHELAHNLMEHVQKGKTNAVLGSIADIGIAVLTGVHSSTFQNVGARAYSQSFEQEADYIGVYMAANAGFNMLNAPNFWRRFASKYPHLIHLAGNSHPSTAKRHVALSLAVKEIESKKLKGQPIVPSHSPSLAIKNSSDHDTSNYND